MSIGKIHSFESFGAVDGPGVRFVVFMQGCSLRCAYCHNPDTWSFSGAKYEMSAQDVMEKIRSYKNFISRGGVTVSGGEPLLQSKFVAELAELCRNEKLHFAIDTAGSVPIEKSSCAIDSADLILLDIKDLDSDDCISLTEQTNFNTLATLDYCEKTSKDVWIRYVLVPRLTFTTEKIKNLGNFLSNYTCVKKIELLPYHVMGVYKWEQLGLQYRLDGIEPPSKSEVSKAYDILKSFATLKDKILL